MIVTALRLGGGTRLKIVEAMAKGKAIVSTRLGAEGIDVVHGESALLADDRKPLPITSRACWPTAHCERGWVQQRGGSQKSATVGRRW